MVFAVGEFRGPSPEPYGPLRGHREHAADTRPVLSNEAVKWKMLPARKPEEPGGAIDMLAVLALLFRLLGGPGRPAPCPRPEAHARVSGR